MPSKSFREIYETMGLSCSIPSHSVNSTILSSLTTGSMTVKVVVDGVQAGTITVLQSASASSYGGGMNYEANKTEGEAPLTVVFGSASQGATATNSFYDFDDPYATSSTATGMRATHTYEMPGNYTVTHTIINGANTHTDTIHITVSEPASTTPTPIAAVPAARGPRQPENRYWKLQHKMDNKAFLYTTLFKVPEIRHFRA